MTVCTCPESGHLWPCPAYRAERAEVILVAVPYSDDDLGDDPAEFDEWLEANA